MFIKPWVLSRRLDDRWLSGQIVLELDRSTQNSAIRLMEALRNRGDHAIKRQTPLIPVMMLMHSDVDCDEPLSDCLEMGLAGEFGSTSAGTGWVQRAGSKRQLTFIIASGRLGPALICIAS